MGRNVQAQAMAVLPAKLAEGILLYQTGLSNCLFSGYYYFYISQHQTPSFYTALLSQVGFYFCGQERATASTYTLMKRANYPKMALSKITCLSIQAGIVCFIQITILILYGDFKYKP